MRRRRDSTGRGYSRAMGEVIVMVVPSVSKVSLLHRFWKIKEIMPRPRRLIGKLARGQSSSKVNQSRWTMLRGLEIDSQ